jgi:hypothetical protein
MFFVCWHSYGQSNFTDVVYLKNGSIIRGVIVEQVPNQSLKIKTFDKNVFVYKYDEIEKISKEEAESTQTVTKLKSPKKVNSDTTNRVITNGHIFINFNLGFAGNAAKQTLDNSSSSSYYTSYDEFGNVTSYTYTSTNTNVTGSLGKGILANLRIGYQISKAIAFDLGMSYLIGGKITGSSSYKDQYGNTISNSGSESHALIFNLNPAISISHAQNLFGFYARSGILIGIAPKLISDNTVNNSSGSSSYYNRVQKTEFTGGVPFGFSNSLGITYSITPSISIVSELNLYTQSWAPEKSVITEYRLDGVDKLYSLTDKETTYANSYDYSSSNNTNSNNTELKFYMPLSSFSFNLGIKLNL